MRRKYGQKEEKRDFGSISVIEIAFAFDAMPRQVER